MSRIGFHPEALTEFVESAAYYESQHPNLGHRFIDAVEEAVHHIGTLTLGRIRNFIPSLNRMFGNAG